MHRNQSNHLIFQSSSKNGFFIANHATKATANIAVKIYMYVRDARLQLHFVVVIVRETIILARVLQITAKRVLSIFGKRINDESE